MNNFKIISTKKLINKNVIKLVQLLTPIKSEIYINSNGRHINAKSILGILSANISENDELIFEVVDVNYLEEVKKLINNYFEKD